MRALFFVLMAAVLMAGFLATAQKAEAQVAVQVGPAPDCPYGYYDVPPYDCAPYGYYGPDWYTDGVFIGAGPWFHGPERFWGHVDNHFDRDHFRGRRPEHGERADRPAGRVGNFHGNEMRDGHGHRR